MESGDPSVFQLLDPLGQFEDSVAKGNVKMRHLPVVLNIPVKGSLEYVFIVLDMVMESMNLFFEAANFAGLLGIVSGNGCEEPFSDGSENVSVEVGVGRQGGCNGTGRHRWFWTLDWTDRERDAVFGGRGIGEIDRTV